MWDIVEKNNLFHESYNFDTGLPPSDEIRISDVELKELVETQTKNLIIKYAQKDVC